MSELDPDQTVTGVGSRIGPLDLLVIAVLLGLLLIAARYQLSGFEGRSTPPPPSAADANDAAS